MSKGARWAWARWDQEWLPIERRVSKPMKLACQECGHIHPANAARAIGIFDTRQPRRFVSILGGPVRSTREAAELDWCERQAGE